MILWSDDNISISMIFNNLTGQNFKADEYKAYIRNIAFGKWDLCQARLNFIRRYIDSKRHNSSFITSQ